VETEPTLDFEANEWIEVGHACNIIYISHLGGSVTFGEKMWTEARRRDWQHAVDTQVVGDAVAWIWNLVGTYLYDAHQVVDWYHATEHLALSAQLTFGEETSAANYWLKQQETPLFQGNSYLWSRPSSILLTQRQSKKSYSGLEEFFHLLARG
jgi:hypothetical protein